MPLYEYRTYDPECGLRVLFEHPDSLSADEFARRVINAEVSAMDKWLKEEQPRMLEYERKRLQELKRVRYDRRAAGVAPEVLDPIYGNETAIDVMLDYYEGQVHHHVHEVSYSHLTSGIVAALEADGFSQVSGSASVVRANMTNIVGIGACACGQRHLVSSTDKDDFAHHVCSLLESPQSATA